MDQNQKLTEPVGVIGAGKMGSALVRGLLKKKLIEPDQIFAYDILYEDLMELVKETDINAALNNLHVVDQCKIIFLCIKPQVFETTLQKLQPYFTNDHLVISIAAGVPLTTIERFLLYHFQQMLLTK